MRLPPWGRRARRGGTARATEGPVKRDARGISFSLCTWSQPHTSMGREVLENAIPGGARESQSRNAGETPHGRATSGGPRHTERSHTVASARP